MTLKKLTPQRTVSPRSAYRVLYVEDEDQNWQVAELLLREKYSIQRARDARETFAMLNQEQFDVVLMDIQLSGSDLDGIGITRALKGLLTEAAPPYAKLNSPLQCPIIFVTAYNARYSRDELVAAGGDELIPKPVDFTRLSLAISKLIARRMSSGKA